MPFWQGYYISPQPEGWQNLAKLDIEERGSESLIF